MNKQELITRNSGVKLYDLSDPIDLHRMNMNLAYCSKKEKEPTFKLIAPFGHHLKFKADYYYFESENNPITEQILEEMGFENSSYIKAKILIVNLFQIEWDFYDFYLDRKPLNIQTANQLHQFIELLK